MSRHGGTQRRRFRFGGHLEHRHWALLVSGLLCLLLAMVPLPLHAAAEEDATDDEQEPASEPDEPAARPIYFLLPVEADSDSGAANGDAVIIRLSPANSVPIGRKWRLLNLATFSLADAPHSHFRIL